jgi:hypothetical protein
MTDIFGVQAVIDFLQSIYNGITGLAWAIVEPILAFMLQLLADIAVILSYPFIAFFEYLVQYSNMLVDQVIELANNFFALNGHIADIFTSMLSLMFDASLMAMLTVIVSLVVTLRVYSFLKDVSILGNKI